MIATDIEMELNKITQENINLKKLVEQLELKLIKNQEKVESIKSKYFELFEKHKILED